MSNQGKNIFSLWAGWHFSEMPKFLFSVWKNYLMFAGNFFSVPLLLKTFFSPWRRYSWMYPKAFNIAEFFSTLISNTFSRILGAIMRIVLLIFGIFFQIFVFVSGLVILIGWVFMPFLVLMGFVIAFIY